jgi:hypothetical protein
MVRSPLIWLDRLDPVQTMETARKDDPTLQAMEAVFAALKEAMGVGEPKALSATQIIQLAHERTDPVNGFQLRHPGLKEALLTVAGQRDSIDACELGKPDSSTKFRKRVANLPKRASTSRSFSPI